MKLWEKKEDCCGCGACFNVCPKDCIAMEADKEGFLYPIIDETECINCNKCVKVCPLKIKIDKNIVTAKKFLGVKTKDKNTLKESSSGGAFTLISDYILNKNGYVYGAIFDESFFVKHTEASKKSDRDKMRGSKYVQSDIDDIFRKIKMRLEADNYVLFTGAPCQVHGLKLFLEKDYEKLITVDFICHSIPSPMIWKAYISDLQKKGEIKNFNFRDKANGWRKAIIAYECNGKTVYKSFWRDVYTWLFLDSRIQRPVCSSCQYTTFNRLGDITIGDYWGVETINAAFDEDTGVSSVMLHNQKAIDIFEEIKQNCDFFEAKGPEQITQTHLVRPSKHSPHRNKFFRDYNKYGPIYLKYIYIMNVTLFGRLKNRIIKLVKR